MATYKRLDDNGLLYFTQSFLGRIRALIPTKTSQLTNDSNFIRDASYVHTDNNYSASEKSKVSGAAPLVSPGFSGTPTAPTAASGTNTTQIATTAFVMTAISGLVGIDFQIVQALPATGAAGTIYLLPNGSSTARNVYDEYIWISSNSAYEKIGSTQVDLSGYVQSNELPAITNSEIDDIVSSAFSN